MSDDVAEYFHRASTRLPSDGYNGEFSGRVLAYVGSDRGGGFVSFTAEPRPRAYSSHDGLTWGELRLP